MAVSTTSTAALADELIEALGTVRRQLRRQVERPWSPTAVSAAQAELVRVVRRMPGISVAAAATELGTAPNTVSTLVGALVDAGLVRREPDPHDRRFARLYLTPEAARQVTKWRDLRAARLREVLDRLPADDRERLADGVAVLTRVAAELREDEP